MAEFKHYLEIDLLKALAIISVLVMHSESFAVGTERMVVFAFFLSQAVPVFILMMSINWGASFMRRNYLELKQLYSIDYFKSRFVRIVYPFILAYIVAVALGLYLHKELNLKISVIPIEGPGNYFVTLLFEFIFIFPLLFYLWRKKPG